MIEFRNWQGDHLHLSTSLKSHSLDLGIPIHVHVLIEEHAAIRAVSLASIALTGLYEHAHVREMVLGLEGEENAVGAGGIFAAAVALLVVGGRGSLVNLRSNVVPVDFVQSGRQVWYWVAVVGHAPAGRQLCVQPRREVHVTNAWRSKRRQLEANRSSLLVDEREIGCGVRSQSSSERVADRADRAAGGALLQRSRDSRTHLALNHQVRIPESCSATEAGF